MGKFIFYANDNCSGDVVGTLEDNYKRDMNLKTEWQWENDKIKSVEFEGIKPNTILELWDAGFSNNKNDDDWIRVRFRTPNGKINKLRENPGNSSLDYKHYGDGELDEVSHIVIVPGGNEAVITFELEKVKNWSRKDGRAHDFKVSDSRFRIWKPTIDETDGAINLNFEMQRMRGLLKADQAAIYLNFDKEGILINAKSTIEFAGKNPIVTYLEAVGEADAELANAIDDPRFKGMALAGAMASKMGAALLTAIEDLNEGGGRLEFPNVVETEMKVIASAVHKAIHGGKIPYGSLVSFKSHHGNYLRSKSNGELVSDRKSIASEEQFSILSAENPNSRSGNIQFGDKVLLKSSYKNYMAANGNGTAHSGQKNINDGSIWTLVNPENKNDTNEISEDYKVGFLSSNNKYLVAESNSPTVNANRELLGSWEKWEPTYVGKGKPADASFENQLVKTSNHPAVYLVRNGVRRHIPDRTTLTAMGFTWGDVKIINNGIMEEIHRGTAIPSRKDGNVYKGSGNEVYIMEDQKRRWARTASVFNNDWSRVKHISDNDLNEIPLGADKR